MDLNGKVAFVTGGSGDIGRAIAEALAASGTDVAVSYVGEAGRAGQPVILRRRLGPAVDWRGRARAGRAGLRR